MFHHPDWAVGSYSSGPPAARSAGTNATGGFPQPLGPPYTTCRGIMELTHTFSYRQAFFTNKERPEKSNAFKPLPHCLQRGGEKMILSEAFSVRHAMTKIRESRWRWWLSRSLKCMPELESNFRSFSSARTAPEKVPEYFVYSYRLQVSWRWQENLQPFSAT